MSKDCVSCSQNATKKRISSEWVQWCICTDTHLSPSRESVVRVHTGPIAFQTSSPEKNHSDRGFWLHIRELTEWWTYWKSGRVQNRPKIDDGQIIWFTLVVIAMRTIPAASRPGVVSIFDLVQADTMGPLSKHLPNCSERKHVFLWIAMGAAVRSKVLWSNDQRNRMMWVKSPPKLKKRA